MSLEYRRIKRFSEDGFHPVGRYRGLGRRDALESDRSVVFLGRDAFACYRRVAVAVIEGARAFVAAHEIVHSVISSSTVIIFAHRLKAVLSSRRSSCMTVFSGPAERKCAIVPTRCHHKSQCLDGARSCGRGVPILTGGTTNGGSTGRR